MNVTTTHDPHGGGHPRLVFKLGDNHQALELLPGVTRIGSAADADLRLPGLHEHHAEVRRDSDDEYTYVHLGNSGVSTVNGRPVGEKVLHTGDRIMLGSWTMSFSREEFADHGRPYGGRQGGEGALQRLQGHPRGRGTTAAGSDGTDSDPGEYF